MDVTLEAKMIKIPKQEYTAQFDAHGIGSRLDVVIAIV
jgi:hypothetical protein